MSLPANLFEPLPDARHGEVFSELLRRPGCRVERIVSLGQHTPSEHPWCQPYDEWVVVLSGAARLLMEGREVDLKPGDHLLIPANVEHWVTFTDPQQPTVWLAIHLQ